MRVNTQEPEEFEQLEFDIPLEYGHASVTPHDGIDGERMQPQNCPRCGRLLFWADQAARGVLFVPCRKCKRDTLHILEPKVKRIGFTSD